MTQELKAGQRVKVTIEGTVRLGWEDIDTLGLDLDDGKYIYLEGEESSHVVVEVIPEPLKDGLYYNADSADEPFTQMSLMYKLEGGQWYNSRLDVIDLSAGTIAGMVRVGPVDS